MSSRGLDVVQVLTQMSISATSEDPNHTKCGCRMMLNARYVTVGDGFLMTVEALRIRMIPHAILEVMSPALICCTCVKALYSLVHTPLAGMHRKGCMVALSLFGAFVQGMCTTLNFCHPRSEVARHFPFERLMHTDARKVMTLGELLLRVLVEIFHQSFASIPAGVQLIYQDSTILGRKQEQLHHDKTEDAVYYVGACEAAIADVTPTSKRSL